MPEALDLSEPDLQARASRGSSRGFLVALRSSELSLAVAGAGLPGFSLPFAAGSSLLPARMGLCAKLGEVQTEAAASLERVVKMALSGTDRCARASPPSR